MKKFGKKLTSLLIVFAFLLVSFWTVPQKAEAANKLVSGKWFRYTDGIGFWLTIENQEDPGSNGYLCTIDSDRGLTGKTNNMMTFGLKKIKGKSNVYKSTGLTLFNGKSTTKMVYTLTLKSNKKIKLTVKQKKRTVFSDYTDYVKGTWQVSEWWNSKKNKWEEYEISF